jgi:hypothetical protein
VEPAPNPSDIGQTRHTHPAQSANLGHSNAEMINDVRRMKDLG